MITIFFIKGKIFRNCSNCESTSSLFKNSRKLKFMFLVPSPAKSSNIQVNHEKCHIVLFYFGCFCNNSTIIHVPNSDATCMPKGCLGKSTFGRRE